MPGPSALFGRFSRLEQHFLRRLELVLHEAEGETRPELMIIFRQVPTPVLEVLARDPNGLQPVQIQIHGLKPVRYHIRTAQTDLGRRLRVLFSRALGKVNLQLTEDPPGEIHLLYHVHYSPDVLKRLSG